MRIVIPRSARLSVGVVLVAVGLVGAVRAVDPAGNAVSAGVPSGFDKVIEDNANRMVREGRQTFRFDTFGDEAFWGDALQLHKAIAGEKHGGVGGGVSPKTALSVGLKVDVGALPPALQEQLKAGKVDLDDPATTLALLKLNAVVGVTGFFDARGSIRSIGLQCAFCHSTVVDAPAPAIGRRLDGWANRDLNVGAIVSLAPNLKPFTDLLGVDVATVKTVLASWGPGRFDAELDKDGKALRPDGKQAGTLIPPAFGLAGVNPAHVDRVRLGHLLERVRRRDRDARLGHVLRCAAEQSGPIPGGGAEWLRQHAWCARPADREARGPAFLSTVHPRTEGARRLLQCGGGEPRQGAIQRQGAVRELPRAAALHRAGQQPTRARRDRCRRVPGGPLAYAHVPHRAAGRGLGTSEGRVLSRRPVRDAARCGGPLRHVLQAEPQRPREAGSYRIPEGALGRRSHSSRACELPQISDPLNAVQA